MSDLQCCVGAPCRTEATGGLRCFPGRASSLDLSGKRVTIYIHIHIQFLIIYIYTYIYIDILRGSHLAGLRRREDFGAFRGGRPPRPLPKPHIYMYVSIYIYMLYIYIYIYICVCVCVCVCVSEHLARLRRREDFGAFRGGRPPRPLPKPLHLRRHSAQPCNCIRASRLP